MPSADSTKGLDRSEAPGGPCSRPGGLSKPENQFFSIGREGCPVFPSPRLPTGAGGGGGGVWSVGEGE